MPDLRKAPRRPLLCAEPLEGRWLLSAPAAAQVPAPSADAPTAPDRVFVVAIVPAETRDDDFPLSPSSLTTPVMAALQGRYPGARVIDAERSADGPAQEVDILATYGGTVLDLAVTPGGVLIESQVALDSAELPAPVIDWVRRQFPAGTIGDAQAVTSNGVVSYEMTIASPGQTSLEATVRLAPAPAPDRTVEVVLPQPASSRPVPSGFVADVPSAEAATHERRVAPSVAFDVAKAPATQERMTPAEDSRDVEARRSTDLLVEDDAAAVAGRDRGADATHVTLRAFANAVMRGLLQPDFARLADLPGVKLPRDLVAAERALRALLQALDLAAAGATGGGAADLGASGAAALLAAAQVFLAEARRRREVPLFVFHAPTHRRPGRIVRGRR